MYDQIPINPQQQLAELQLALSKASQGGNLQKTFTQSSNQLTGLTAFSLEAPAKTFYPVLTPVRNFLPRATGGVGIQANWRAVTGVNAGRASVGVSEGNRGQTQTVTVKEYMASFRAIGIDSFVTEEARLAGEGFDDVEARAVQSNLNALMVAEEKLILGGLGTYGLGQPTGLVMAVGSGTGGAIANGTAVFVRCCALTMEGLENAQAGVVRGLVSRTTANGASDTFGGGYSRASASATATTSVAGSRITASVTPVKGAVGYAWFVGADATTMYLTSVTTVSATTILSMPSGSEGTLGADLIANDRSQNALVFDGFFSLIASSSSGAYHYALPTNVGSGQTLTADGAGGIVEIDAALKWYWDNHRISPTRMYVNAQELNSFRKLALSGGANNTQRFMFQTDQKGIILSGRVRSYTNPFGMGGAMDVEIALHPFVPAGTIFFMTQSLPYSLPGVTDVNRILCRRDYYQLIYPMTSRKKEFGVYSDQLLQTYFPPANGMLTNIAAT